MGISQDLRKMRQILRKPDAEMRHLALPQSKTAARAGRCFIFA